MEKLVLELLLDDACRASAHACSGTAAREPRVDRWRRRLSAVRSVLRGPSRGGRPHPLTREGSRREGVYVNAIVQNYIENRTYFREDQLADEAYVARLISAVRLGRLGKAREIAKPAAYLNSDDAGFITGEIIRCVGGTALSA